MLNRLHRFPEIFAAHRQAGAWVDLSLRYLGAVLARDQSFPYDVTLRDGVRFRFESGEEIKVFWNIFFRSCYQVAAEDRVIVDAGGNIGLFAVWAARRAPRARIYSFEPWPSSYERLVRHLEINGVSDRVVAEKLALGGDSGSRRMFGSDGESCNNRMDLDRSVPPAEGPSPGGVVAACRTLETALEALGVGAIDLLKMDIEGSEYETLLATPPALLRRIQRINLEYHEVPAHLPYSKERLFEHLARGGHVPVSVVEDEDRTGFALFAQRGH
jgi:FkbM family methyltransferase